MGNSKQFKYINITFLKPIFIKKFLLMHKSFTKIFSKLAKKAFHVEMEG